MKASTTQAGQGRRIAVIEEIADNIYSVKFILQSLGYDVHSFSSEKPFLQELIRFQPELILVDMMIPGGRAYQIIRKIRASSLSGVPLVAITAQAMQGNEDEVLKSGAQDVLPKPYSVSDLQQKLKQWLSDGRRER